MFFNFQSLSHLRKLLDQLDNIEFMGIFISSYYYPLAIVLGWIQGIFCVQINGGNEAMSRR
jgi:hypothetical protein